MLRYPKASGLGCREREEEISDEQEREAGVRACDLISHSKDEDADCKARGSQGSTQQEVRVRFFHFRRITLTIQCGRYI